MSFLNPSFDEEQAYLRRAASAMKAAALLLTLRQMALSRQMEKLSNSMAVADRAGDQDAVGRLAAKHLEISKRKYHYDSAKGREGYIFEVLKDVFRKELEEPWPS